MYFGGLHVVPSRIPCSGTLGGAPPRPIPWPLEPDRFGALTIISTGSFPDEIKGQFAGCSFLRLCGFPLFAGFLHFFGGLLFSHARQNAFPDKPQPAAASVAVIRPDLDCRILGSLSITDFSRRYVHPPPRFPHARSETGGFERPCPGAFHTTYSAEILKTLASLCRIFLLSFIMV